jgi:hypothetical protein
MLFFLKLYMFTLPGRIVKHVSMFVNATYVKKKTAVFEIPNAIQL